MTRHKKISFLKSLLRLVGSALGVIIVRDDVKVALATFLLFFTIAEILGIAEEDDQ